MAEGIPQVSLNSGHVMPVIGLGTAGEQHPPDLDSTFLDAIEAGYRHFDTAALYGTERPLGRALSQALQRGLVRSRTDLFITTKLWCTDAHPDLVLPALQKSLNNLGLDYVDLYLIHWPVRVKAGEIKLPIPKEELLPFEMRSTWEAMEECHRLGLVKSIGVSNFSSKKLSQLLDHASIPPAVNQVASSIIFGRNEYFLESKKTEKILRRAWGSCHRMVTFSGKWSSMGISLGHGEPSVERNCASKREDGCTGCSEVGV